MVFGIGFRCYFIPSKLAFTWSKWTHKRKRIVKFRSMAKQIFINLAVKDLQKSMDFYKALGFSNNPQFSDDTAKVWFGVNTFS